MSTTQPTSICHYHYDPLDRLINLTQPATPAQLRFYCKSRLATEIQGAMQHTNFQHGDQLLAQQQRQGDGVDTTLMVTNRGRSVLQTLKANNDRHTIAYSPYGHRLEESGLLSLLGFNGERRDPVTGHYLLGNGYRAFNPVLMRFNSPDSWSPFGKGGLNPYAYCANDPINKIDLNGHAPISLFGMVMVKTRIRHWRLNRILQPGKLEETAHSGLTPQRALTLAENLQEVYNSLKRIDSHRMDVLKSDYEHRLSPNLKNITAGFIAGHKPPFPLDDLPTTLRSFVQTPYRPLNSAKLLETLMENTSTQGTNSYYMNRLANSDPLMHNSGVEIPPHIKEAYLARLRHPSATHDDLIGKPHRIRDEIRGE